MDATFMIAMNIIDVRHLKDLKIPLSDTERKSLILTGKNGSGKSSVLEALKKFLEYAVSGNFHSREETEKSYNTFLKKTKPGASTESAKFNAEQQKKYLAVCQSHYQQWFSGAVAEFSSYADLRSKYQAGEFVLAYYGDKREIEVQVSKNIEKVDLKPVYTIKDKPSRQLVKYMVNLKTTAAFAETSGNRRRSDEINAWFIRFENILRAIYEDESLRLDFNIETFKFSILQNGREPFDFQTMSMGYAAVFDIIGDLIMRMEAQHSYDLEGLVLIDEVETHLHVELQKKIVPILMGLFPNIQFVLTTHSPFILNSTPNAVVYDLETHTLVPNGLTNLPYEGIVEGYFQVNTMSEELQDKFDQYKELVEKSALTDADYARLSELELYLDDVPDFLALDFASEYERLKQELKYRG